MKISLLLLKNKAKGLIFRTCFVLFITLVLFLMIDLLAYSHFYKYKSFSSAEGYAILFEGDADFENTIIYCDNGVLCYLTDQTEIPMGLEVCMQSSSSITFKNYINKYYNDILGDSEIVISKTTATRFALEKGDTVYLDRGDSINRYVYSIKDIIEDIPSVFGVSDRYVAIIGYSQTYCDNVRYKTLAFYEGEMKDLEVGSNYVRHIAFKEEANKELFYFLAFLAVYIVLLCAVLCFVVYEQNIGIKRELMKLKRMGWGSHKIIWIKLSCNIIMMFPLALVPLILAIFFRSAVAVLTVNVVLLLLTCLIALIRDCKKYRGEKYIAL